MVSEALGRASPWDPKVRAVGWWWLVWAEEHCWRELGTLLVRLQTGRDCRPVSSCLSSNHHVTQELVGNENIQSWPRSQSLSPERLVTCPKTQNKRQIPTKVQIEKHFLLPPSAQEGRTVPPLGSGINLRRGEESPEPSEGLAGLPRG